MWLWSAALTLLFAYTTSLQAQINYFQGWNTAGNLAGWTFNEGGVNNTGTPCEGANGAHRNFPATSLAFTWTLTSPNLAPPGGNNGLPISVSFQFKRTNSGQFNSMRSAWSTNGTTWTEVNHTVSNQNCNTYTMNIAAPTPGAPIFIRLQAARDVVLPPPLGSAANYLFDAVNVQQAPLQCPAATFSVVNNCGGATYQLSANVTTAGPNAQLLYSVDGIPQTPVAVTGNGVFSTPPIPVTAAVTYTLTNGHVALGCAALNGYAFSTCPIVLDCDQVLTIEHCYRNNDPRTFHFVNPSANTIDIQFLPASPIASGDGINFFNGPPGVNQISVPPFGTDLSNIGLFTSPGDVFSFSIDADGSGSCADGVVNAPWTFEVKCTPDCDAPQADVNVQPSDCNTGTYTIDVDLFYLGATNGVDNDEAGIRYAVDGGPPVDLTGLTADIHTLGPFALPSTVAITLLHADDELCNSFLGTYGRATPCPPANDLCGSAQMLAVNAPGACMGAAVTGTTFDANNETTNPSCGAAGSYRDVWYTFMSGWTQSPLTIGITAGTVTNWGVQVFTACGGTPLVCNASNPTSVAVPNLLPHTQYWVRVFTNTNLGDPGSFSICLSAAPRANVCGTTVYDTGGPTGNYANNENYSVTYCSSTFGDLVTATFTQFSTEATYDRLYIHNGPSTASPLFSSGNGAGNGAGNPGPGGWWGTTIPGPFTSSHPSGCLTFRFWSDPSITAAGWTANLTCCEAPAATVTAGVVQSPLCVGNTIELTATSPTATVFTWSGPASFSSTAQNATRANAQSTHSGTYQVIARNGPNGCPSAPATVAVSVVPPPVITATSSAAAVCPGNTVDLSAPTPTTLISSNFNSGVHGWTTLNQSTGGTPANAAWTLRPSPFTQSGATFSSNDASQYFLSNSDAQGSGSTTNASLISPTFSTLGYNTVTLSFWHHYRHSNNQASVQVSTNGGGTWTTVQAYTTTQGAANAFVLASVNLNAFANLPSVQVRFNHLSNFGWYWAIDNVTISAGTPPLTFAWSSNPSGFSSTAQNPSGVQVNTNTTYSVTVTSAPGCSSTSSTTVLTDAPLQGTVNGPANFAYCIGTSSVNLSGSASGGGEPYLLEWIDATNTVVGTGPNLVNFTPATSTTVSLRVTDDCGTVGVFGTRTVTVNPLPNVQVTPPVASNCGGGISTLVASGADTYTWSPAAGLSSTVGSTVQANPSGFIAIYTVTGTDVNGCQNTATAQVLVSSVPAQGTTTNRTLCVNQNLPMNQGLTLTCPPFQATAAYGFPNTNMPTNTNCGGTGFETVSTLTLPALPPGAVPFAARLVLNNVQAFSNIAATSWLSEIRVATTGALTVGETQISAVNNAGTIAQVIVTIPPANYPVAGGIVNLRLRETVNDGTTNLLGACIFDALAPDGQVGSAAIEVEFSMPTTARWYDAPVGGNLVFTGSVFNPITANVVSNAVDGYYTFWAACEGNGCESTRTASTFVVGSQTMILETYTDAFPTDQSWEVEDAVTGVVLHQGQGLFIPPDAVFQLPYCINNDRCYKFRMTDTGAGSTGNPGYQVRTTDGRRYIDNTANFNFNGTSEITGNSYGFCTPMGTNVPIYTSCDKEFWRTGEYLVADEDLDVSAVWIPNGPNNVQSPNTGYEFWFFNPNGGYSFRRFRSHNQSDGYGSVGATRACHMRVNNWAVAQHIPEFDLHNVRIRARVNGVNKAWGSACRFVRNEALAQCPPTKLMDIPGNQFLSCNQFRQWNVPGSRIHARPVSGANLYQWRFRIPAENVEIIRTSTSYFLNLNWGPLVADPLQNGKTYEVDVRASRDGGITWCGLGGDPWGHVCLLTIGTQPAQGGGQNLAMEGGNELFNLWPNPNKGEDLWISLDELPAQTETVTVDIHDLFGKRVSAQVIATQGDHLYTVLPLRNDLAGGVYTVTLTAGDLQYMKRLVVQP